MTDVAYEGLLGQWSGAADEEFLRGLDKLRNEEAGVRSAGGDDDLTGLDLVDWNGDEAGAEGVTQVAGRDDSDGIPLGDGLKLVVVGVGEGGAEGGGVVVRPGFEPPEGGPVGTRAGAADEWFRGDVSSGDRLLSCEAVRRGHKQDPRLGVEDRQGEAVGRDRQWCADDQGVDLPVG